MSVEERLVENGYDGAFYIADTAYDDALIGVTADAVCVYDYELMVEGLMAKEGCSREDAEDHIHYNVLSATPCIIVFRLI